MPINRNSLLSDTKLYLTDKNILTDDQLKSINEAVISDVGDDDTNYSEVLCKSLRAAATLNKNLAVNEGSIKREKSFQREVEYYNSNEEGFWQNYLDNIADTCLYLPGGGYTLVSSNKRGFFANVSTSVNPTKDCCDGRR